MLFADAQTSPVPADIVDAGDTATPPTDIYDAMYQLVPQQPAGALEPVFGTVSGAEAIAPGTALLLYVKVGGTSTTVTVQVPGVQPYTGAERDDLAVSGLSNTERVFYLPSGIADATDSIVVSYSPSTAVTTALVQVY